MSFGLYLDAAANLLVAAAFIMIGARFYLAPVDPEKTRAARAFGSWWLLFGVQSIVAAIRTAGAAAGFLGPAPFHALFMMETALATAALWGLLYHATFVAAGRALGWAAGLLVAGLLIFYMSVLGSRTAVEVVDEVWRTNLVFEPPLSAMQRWAMTISYYGVLTGAALVYLAIARRVQDLSARRRALAVAAALATIGVVDALILGPTEPTPWAPILSVAKIPAAALVWWAYFRQEPPAAEAGHQPPGVGGPG